ncbi:MULTISPECIES: GTP cyclohydrolase I FolE [Priestia]|uniref:GTP cyclohydrolase I FolE n=1 Tax=Priestia TaxID=2800373 RepID=UPI001C8ECC38|nr:GTP cyclohydrolase I FolE [Priestia aryabhattai]MBY0213526.1 GTP cyclohydrolase I FolE [Priestia aryabhattai]MDT0148398.1 GTP cyclohydrolase I FolE [Priestia aryabhattai]MDT0153736.1 GTP cyclohydrolase I FolE [Priestia aryabhattai]
MALSTQNLIAQKFLETVGTNSTEIDKKIGQADTFMNAVKELIDLCGDNPERDGLEETPYRVLKAFLEYTEGYREDPKAHLEKTFDVNHNELVLIRDIEFHSMCEHHFAPFFGVAHVGYIPDKKITGLSKIARTVEGYAKRFQVQERLTNEIADAIEEVLEPKGVMVIIEAKHMCMCGRGIKKSSASTATSSVRGIFMEKPEVRGEFLSLLQRQM